MLALNPPLLADGNPQSEIQRRVPSGRLHPALYNERNPDLVQAVHRDFARSGATLLRTNSAGANRLELDPLGMEERCEALNNAASALLFDAVGARGIRMGEIGAIPPLAHVSSAEERERAYSEQVIYLSDTGVTFFLASHFTSVEELCRLIEVVRRNSDAPVLAQIQFDDLGRSEEGLTAGQAAKKLVSNGADALGLSCRPALPRAEGVVDGLLSAGLPVSLMPGMHPPAEERDRPQAGEMEPERFAEEMARLIDRGVAIAGGCCGVSPAHIAALAKRMPLRA